ncbi:hypothetical protein GCM10007424_12540 [Flavobacterium suaedae]|uniref:YncE family protein n=1 Tax=Flavobacterium suaedae TaxID=1767027 RepID=A0ABQ1JPA3_9FLAO|nr:DUF5074 domain-containing protein [Flavobacterium suaedae]GGB74118.1 hypothetical protein GCM10007424_12540 [Flavobacterium suaedae]
MKLNKLILSAFAGALFLTSCSSDDDAITEPAPTGDYVNGMFIVNEANYGAGNSTISFYSEEGVLSNGIFASVNGFDLGDTAQSMGFNDDLAYIVVNYSNKIEVVNRYTFESVATVDTGLDNPRYIAFENGKAYVTNWADPTDTEDDYVAVIDLSSNTVIASIAVAEGPENILEENDMIYVAHKGGYGYGTTISVIDPSTDAISTTIPVGDVPNAMEAENGKLYVICGGAPSWSSAETSGELYVVNLADNTVETSYAFSGMVHPSNASIENGTLYYTVDAAIYGMSLTATTLPETPIFSVTEQGAYGIYGFKAENNKIYVGDAVDYNSAGNVYIYSLTGDLQQTLSVGISPNGFYFNN